MSAFCQKCRDGPPCPSLKHRTDSGYSYHGCHCDECRAAHRNRQRGERRAQVRDQRGRLKPRYPTSGQVKRRQKEKFARVPTPRAGVNRYLGAWTEGEDRIALDEGLLLIEAAYILGRSPKAVGNRRWKIRAGLIKKYPLT